MPDQPVTPEELDKEFKKAIERGRDGVALLLEIINQIHLSDQPEWKKVREKDERLQDLIHAVLGEINKAGWMPQGEVLILEHIVAALVVIEKTLAELKDAALPTPFKTAKEQGQ